MLSVLPKTKHISKSLSKRNFSVGNAMIECMTDANTLLPLGLVGGLSVIVARRYLVARPDQYLIRTGLFIKDIEVNKQAFLFPFQKYEFISMHPKSYTFELSSMSIEKLQFLLPGVFTIGPKDDIESLIKYVRLLAGMSDEHEENSLQSIILSIIEGETRSKSGAMTMEAIFNDRKDFKEKIIDNCQEELSKMGLFIYNANIKELQDGEGSNYFANMRQKILSETENKAKINIAEANKVGNIGAKERDAETRQKVAQLESETVLKENENKQSIEKSNALLSVVVSEAKQKTTIAEIEAVNNANKREAEMQDEVEQKRIAMETNKLRATNLSKANVDAEAIRVIAEADLYSKEQEANGMAKILEAFNGDSNAMMQYLMINRHIYEKLATTNADAIQGLKPKITVWNTGNETSGTDDYTGVISNILKMLPPMLTTIHEQTGIKPSENIISMKKSKINLE